MEYSITRVDSIGDVHRITIIDSSGQDTPKKRSSHKFEESQNEATILRESLTPSPHLSADHESITRLSEELILTPTETDRESSSSPSKRFRDGLLKRFSSLPRTPSTRSTKKRSRTPSPQPPTSPPLPAIPTSPPLPSLPVQSMPVALDLDAHSLPPLPPAHRVIRRIKSRDPAAMWCKEIHSAKTGAERAFLYAEKINELYIRDPGLRDWIVQVTSGGADSFIPFNLIFSHTSIQVPQILASLSVLKLG